MTIHLDSIHDPRLAPYRNLKDRELARLDGRFIAESDLIVRRLLASDYPVESVLVAKRKSQAIAEAVPKHVPLYVLDESELDAVIGYPFHTGVLAVGRRKPSPRFNDILPPTLTPSPGTPGEGGGEGDFERKTALDIPNHPDDNPLPAYRTREPDTPRRSMLVICPDLTNHENLGSLIRISSAFGADAIILGPRSSDPFYRLSIRVSMGTIFSLPIVRSDDLISDLHRLRNDFGYQLAATVLDESAASLDQATRPERFGLVFGNEAKGISPEIIAACDRRITLPMQRGTDSLNVAVAAGIFMYHFTRS
jgi:tRNA G18 (ribose-2'-O)-methylase SpoU